MTRTLKTLMGGALLVLAMAGPQAVAAENDYPSQPIHLLVSSAAGSGIDVASRLVGEKLAKRIGQPVLIENVTGASGLAAMQNMLAAPADGYRIMMMSPGLTILSARNPKRFDIRKDVAPIIQQSAQPLIMFVKAGSAIHSVKDLIDLAKKKPGTLNYGSLGVGSVQNLLMEQFKLVTGTDIAHIPYNGANEAAAAVLSGEIDVSLAGLITVEGMIKEGRLRAIATTTAKGGNGIPGMEEAGVPGYDFSVWTGFGAKAGTPEPIIRRLNAEINEVYKDPEVIQRFKHLYDFSGGTPEAFGKVLKNEVDTWITVIDKSHIKFE